MRMKLGFLFAGQGSQKVGMGKDFCEKYETFGRIFDCLTDDERAAVFAGPAERLSDTRYTQPVMVAFAAGVTELLRERGVEPKMAAGLSLGEYSALSAAGVFSPQEAVALVRKRAEEMSRASEGVDCAMSAVLGADRKTVEECCGEASGLTGEKVQPANFNCPGQIVISGEKTAVSRAAELLTERGAKRCMSLSVSGPFHTEFMRPAGKALEEVFKDTNFGEMKFPVIFNATGREKGEDETVAQLLVRQVSSPVYFEDTIRLMEEQGIDAIIEIVPGKALSGFVKKTAPSIKLFNIDTAEDFERVSSEIAAQIAEQQS